MVLEFVGKVEMRSVCETYRESVNGCPKKPLGKGIKGAKGMKIATTLMMLHFSSAQKYLCLHQNKTFYAVVSLFAHLWTPINYCAHAYSDSLKS